MTDEKTQIIGNALNVTRALPEKPAVELVGTWLWIRFDSKPSDDSRTKLKGACCFWSQKNNRWYCNGANRRGGKGSKTWNEKVKTYGVRNVTEKAEEETVV